MPWGSPPPYRQSDRAKSTVKLQQKTALRAAKEAVVLVVVAGEEKKMSNVDALGGVSKSKQK